MELMEVYHEAMAKWIIARATSGKCEGSEFVFDLIESAIRKEATEILLTPVQESDMVRMDFGRLHCFTIGSPKLPRLSLRTWPSILSSLVMSPQKKHVPKDYSADQTKGSIICNLEKYAYLTASRLSSSTSNRSAQPRPQGGKNRRRPSSKADMLAEQRLPQMVRESRQ
jgi:hypothetical protein